MNILFLSTFRKSAAPAKEKINDLFKTTTFKQVVSGGDNLTVIITNKLGLTITELLAESINRFGFFDIKLNCIAAYEFFSELSDFEKEDHKRVFNAANNLKILHCNAERLAETFNRETDKAETIVFFSPKKSTQNISCLTRNGKKIRIFYI